MGGASASSLVGSGYQVVNTREPLITVVAHGNEFHVCQRSSRREKYKTIVGCFLDRRHAETFGSWLAIDSAQPKPTAPVARSPVIRGGKTVTAKRRKATRRR
jgi:hypothetical protein